MFLNSKDGPFRGASPIPKAASCAFPGYQEQLPASVPDFAGFDEIRGVLKARYVGLPFGGPIEVRSSSGPRPEWERIAHNVSFTKASNPRGCLRRNRREIQHVPDHCSAACAPFLPVARTPIRNLHCNVDPGPQRAEETVTLTFEVLAISLHCPMRTTSRSAAIRRVRLTTSRCADSCRAEAVAPAGRLKSDEFHCGWCYPAPTMKDVLSGG